MPPKEQRTTVGSPGGWDPALVARAPDISKADRQEGYDLSLVEQGPIIPQQPPSRPQTVLPVSGPPNSGSHTSLEKSTGLPATNGYSKYNAKSNSLPWYRTTKGLAIAICVAFVVVGIVVGVAVGVTQSKNKNKPGSGGGVVPGGQPPSASATPSGTSSTSQVQDGTISLGTGVGSGGAPSSTPGIFPVSLSGSGVPPRTSGRG